VYEIDKVTLDIRAALCEESIALMDDIEYLQLCLEDTANERDAVLSETRGGAEPSIAELRGLETKLQQEVLKRVRNVCLLLSRCIRRHHCPCLS
jgi:hypothetical protein